MKKPPTSRRRALALAVAAQDAVTGVAFVGAISPLGERGALRDVRGSMRTLFILGRRAPWLLPPLFGTVARKARSVSMSLITAGDVRPGW